MEFHAINIGAFSFEDVTHPLCMFFFLHPAILGKAKHPWVSVRYFIQSLLLKVYSLSDAPTLNLSS